mgnify:CR=1 FL=1
MKKIATMVVALAMMACCYPVGEASAASYITYYVGDVNNDRFVDATDASEVLAEYAGTSTGSASALQESLADVNRDGKVDATDASEILDIYADLATGMSADGLQEVQIEDLSTRFKPFAGVRYIGSETVDLYSSTDSYDEVVGHIQRGTLFYILEYVGGDWYEVTLLNTEEQAFIQIFEEDRFFFEPGYTVYLFTGEECELKAEESSESETVGTLVNGDLFFVIKDDDTGWISTALNGYAVYLNFSDQPENFEVKK